MIPSDPDRNKPPLSSRNGMCDARNPEETGSFPPAASWPAAINVSRGPSTSHDRSDLLCPPRAAGEIGWLAHYRVLRLLGEGGMGLVFLAEDSVLSRPVALKVIRPEIADAPGIALRFTREARATAAINHDNIVTIYEVGQENGIPYLTMEYLKGISLAQWFDRGHCPSVEVVLRIGREIAAGLSAAHRHSLIHRDIKPANIWLEAPSGHVKILDFGMARSQREDVEITRSGAVMGTPAYMAPEQARGEQVDARSDLFSLGCVMYRLCTSRLPFEGESVMAVLSALSTTTPPGPLELRPGIPPALDELVSRLLAKDPADRPGAAEVLVKQIRAIERDLLAKRKVPQLSATMAPNGDVGTSNQALPVIVSETGQAHPASTRHPRRRKVVITAAVLTALAATAVRTFVFAPQGRNKIVTAAAGPKSAPAHDQAAVVPIVMEEPRDEGMAQTVVSPDRLSPPPHPDAFTGPSHRSAVDIPQSRATTEPGPPRMADVSQNNEQPAEKVAPTVGKASNDTPAAAGADQGLALEGHNRSEREKRIWGDVVDPDRDCKFELEPREDKVRITVPGRTHILSAEIGRTNAPRILRELEGDFDVTVRVAGSSHPAGKPTTTVYPPYHGAGLLIWQDQDNYVRLEIAADIQHGKARPYVNFELRKDGALAASSGIANPDGSNHLRLKRRGAEIYASFGPDGVRWTSFSPVTAHLKDRLSVGVAAINSSTKPFTAEFEAFDVVEREAPIRVQR